MKAIGRVVAAWHLTASLAGAEIDFTNKQGGKPHEALYAVGCFLRDGGLSFGQAKTPRQPVIDVHLHSVSLANLKRFGPNPVTGVSDLRQSRRLEL